MQTILYVNPAGDISGGENSLLALIEGLDKEFRPLLACPCPGRLAERCRDLGVPVFPIPFANPARSTLYSMFIVRPLQNRRLISALGKIAADEGVGLIHANSYLVGPASSIVAGRMRIPSIWHIRDIRLGLKLRILRQMIRRYPDKVLVVSQAVKDTFGDRLADKVQVVYNGVRPPEFTQAERARCREELGIGAEAPLIGNVGVIVHWKGQDIFLRAARRVLGEFPEARFLIIGSARPQSLGFDAEMRKLAAELGIQDKVTFTGFRHDALRIIASLDVYLHTARDPDPLPRVVLEAMGLGIPVVAPESGGLPEMITHGETGLLYPPGDDSSAAREIVRLLREPGTAESIATAAKERIASCFSVETHVCNVMKVYEELLGKRQPSCKAG